MDIIYRCCISLVLSWNYWLFSKLDVVVFGVCFVIRDETKYPVKKTMATFACEANNEITEKAPFEANHFSVVVHALPVFSNSSEITTINNSMQCSSPSMLPMTELVRLTNKQGYLLLGMPDALWTQWEINEQLEQHSNYGSLMVLMRFPLPVMDMPKLKQNHSEGAIDIHSFAAPVKEEKIRMGDLAASADNNRLSISYTLGVFRKN